MYYRVSNGGISKQELEQQKRAAASAAAKTATLQTLPTSLYGEAYHGGTADSGYGNSTLYVTPTYSGSVYCTCVRDSQSGTGGSATLVINNSTQVKQGQATTISFSAGQTINFRLAIGGLEQWGKVTAHAAFTWTLN